MPREEIEWFMKESVHDNEKIHAQQSCTYYSIVNVNKNNYPFLSSYEQEQTWTLTRTISNNHKRYQSSIDNIHLTRPMSSLKTKHVDYENIQIKKNRSNSLLPSILPTDKSPSATAFHPTSMKMNSTVQQTLPSQTRTNNYLNWKNDSPIKNSRPFNKPMRVIHSNGEFVVRI